MPRAHRVTMAVDDYSRLSNIPELQELLTLYYNWEVDPHEPKHLLPVLAALLGIGLLLRVLAKRYYPSWVKLPKDQKL